MNPQEKQINNANSQENTEIKTNHQLPVWLIILLTFISSLLIVGIIFMLVFKDFYVCRHHSNQATKNLTNDMFGDPETLENLDEYYLKDKDNIYYIDGTVLSEVDYDTFQALGYGYAKDQNNIYHKKNKALFDDETFSNLSTKIDIESFVVLGVNYFKDKNMVIYNYRMGGSIEINEIFGADLDSFQIINDPYSQDKNNIYFRSDKSDISDTATLKTDLLNDKLKKYALDKNGVYYFGQKIMGADQSTFEVIVCQIGSGCFAKDKNNVYFENNILEDADPTSFEILTNNNLEYEQDEKHVWRSGKLLLDCSDNNKHLSYKLGVAFCYPEYFAQREVKIIENNNKIFVDGYQGQSVEVFNKDQNEDLKQAVERIFLQNYSKEDCWVETTIDENNSQITRAIINYPPNNDTQNGEPFWANMYNCPEDYARTNGIRYFYTTANSDKFLFFSIGQYGINLSNNDPWQDTAVVF